LQRDGYHTMHIGKWHLGESPHFQPQRVGFDESLGFLWGASKYLRASDPNVENSIQQFDPIDKWLWPNLPFAVLYNGSTWFEPSEYMTDYLGKQAVAAIDANANRPFFMYLAFNAPHTPLQALKSDYDALPQITDHRLRVYAAMIRALDRNVGRVMDELKAKGLDQNTLVFFTSDNGGANYIGLPEINKPFRGWKATFFEGGVHTPFFIRWPATIQAGTTYDKPISHFDIFATAAGAANAPLPTDRIIDGVNLIPYVTGQNTSNPHDFLFWRSGDYKTVLDHGYKLQVSARPNRIWLFNLTNDPNEHHDLSAEMPDKVTEIRAKLDAFNQTQSPPLWASLLEAPIAIDHPLGFPDSPKDDYIYWAN